MKDYHRSFINHSSSYSFDSENARLILKGKPMYHKSNDPVINKKNATQN